MAGTVRLNILPGTKLEPGDPVVEVSYAEKSDIVAATGIVVKVGKDGVIVALTKDDE